MAVRHAAYHTNTAHLTGTQTLSRVNRGDTSPAPASRFDPFQPVVEMHLFECAFGQIYDLQRRLEIAGGETAFRFRNDARDAAGNDTASIFPGPRSQVDDPVRLCDGAHVMFDDYDGIAGVYEALQVLHQPVAIGGVKPRSWLVEDVDRVAALSALQFSRQLDALRLPARQLGRRLTEPQIAKTDLPQHVEGAHHRCLASEEIARIVDRQFEHLGDIAAPD